MHETERAAFDAREGFAIVGQTCNVGGPRVPIAVSRCHGYPGEVLERAVEGLSSQQRRSRDADLWRIIGLGVCNLSDQY